MLINHISSIFEEQDAVEPTPDTPGPSSDSYRGAHPYDVDKVRDESCNVQRRHTVAKYTKGLEKGTGMTLTYSCWILAE